MSVVFPARQERLDWQLVAEVDLASLLAGDTSQVISTSNRVFHKNNFFQKKWRNPPRISLGVSLKGSKRIFDLNHV